MRQLVDDLVVRRRHVGLLRLLEDRLVLDDWLARHQHVWLLHLLIGWLLQLLDHRLNEV